MGRQRVVFIPYVLLLGKGEQIHGGTGLLQPQVVASTVLLLWGSCGVRYAFFVRRRRGPEAGMGGDPPARWQDRCSPRWQSLGSGSRGAVARRLISPGMHANIGWAADLRTRVFILIPLSIIYVGLQALWQTF